MQLALQLSLLVQLPVAQGSLNGSPAYLMTSGGLPRPHLVQLLYEHLLLTGSHSMLNNVQMSSTRPVSLPLHVLSDVLPTLILNTKACSRPPLKLLIINSITKLLHYDKDSAKTLMAKLSEHWHNLSTIVAQLHMLTAMHQLA